MVYHPKVIGKNYDKWTKLMLSELYFEGRGDLVEFRLSLNLPPPYSVEQNKKANDLILSTLYNESWCEDVLKKMTKEEYLKWRDTMVREVHDSECFSEGFILSFYRWNKFFGVLEA